MCMYTRKDIRGQTKGRTNEEEISVEVMGNREKLGQIYVCMDMHIHKHFLYNHIKHNEREFYPYKCSKERYGARERERVSEYEERCAWEQKEKFFQITQELKKPNLKRVFNSEQSKKDLSLVKRNLGRKRE